jgi:uncharacterized protein
MIRTRKIKRKLLELYKQYPVITITGPRQSGKTTLCKEVFPDKPYVSLENLDIRRMAKEDPNGFLAQFPKGAVLDEIQRVPELLSFIQTIIDEKDKEGLFILTGSNQFELLDSINQSLAGRTALLKLLPFSYKELYLNRKQLELNEILYTGFYPRIYKKNLNPTEALSFYVTTYIERDVRNLVNVKDISKFEVFLKLCAGRTGQILNLSNLANDCGINHNTAKSWLSVLEASYIIFLLRPHYKNFNKRLVKSPKLYFVDVGLASFLLGIEKSGDLQYHPLKGALFETFIVSEILKTRLNKVKTNNLYYFRDNVGNEVDLLLDFGTKIIPIEIKSGQTVSDDYFKNLNYYNKLNPEMVKEMFLIYSGSLCYEQKGCFIRNYKDLDVFTNC